MATEAVNLKGAIKAKRGSLVITLNLKWNKPGISVSYVTATRLRCGRTQNGKELPKEINCPKCSWTFWITHMNLFLKALLFNSKMVVQERSFDVNICLIATRGYFLN